MAQTSFVSSDLAVSYRVPRWTPAWAVPEVPVPESDTHDAAIEWLRALLLAWVARSARDIKIARNLGIRWVREEPRAGFDPDLCLIEPAPDPQAPLTSLRLWEPGHSPPLLAIEVVSPGHPYKDYIDTPERCAACGVGELWVYDPMLAGPRAHGGPYLLALWQTRQGGLERVHAGSGPAFSPALQAWLHPRASRLQSGARLSLSEDARGEQPWLTPEQAARAREERALAREEQARALLELERENREVLERRLQELEEREKKDG